MAEEAEIEVERPEPASTADIALAAALDEAHRSGQTLSPKVEAFFDAQTRLAEDQRHHLAVLFELEHRGKFLDNWAKRFKLALQCSTMAVGLAFAAGVGMIVWDSAHSRSLVVEPFSAPGDLAARGLTGQVVATQVMDRLAELQSRPIRRDLLSPTSTRGATTASSSKSPRPASPWTNWKAGCVQSSVTTSMSRARLYTRQTASARGPGPVKAALKP